jgi:VWFA-related protein
MRVHARLLAAGAVAIGLWVQADAQAPPQQPPAQPPPADAQPQRPPVIRSGINFVSVDVIITDKKTGEVVLDMKQDEFEVREDRKPQKVETFETVKIDAELNAGIAPKAIRSLYDEESAAREPNTRLFILLLDDYHVRRGNDMVVKKPLSDFVQNQLAPQDMVAVMYPMTPVSSLTFTRNKDSLLESIKHFEGRKGLYEPRNEFEERYAYYPVETVENIRNDITLGALKGAAVRLGGMRDGRKSIIFVSEGLTSTVPAQLNDPIAAMPGMPGRGGQPSPRGRGNPGTDPSTTNPRVESQQFFNSADLTNRIREAFEIVNRNNTSIYAVDPRGLAVFEYDINQGVGMQTDRMNLNQSLDSLRVLADNTDGRAIVNRNDLATGMKQIMRDMSGYYLLGYTSTAAPTDGRFHTIDVRVKRPGVEVRARKGYFAYTAEDVARASSPAKAGPPKEISNALNAIAVPAGSGHAARFWTGTDVTANGQPRVLFVWEPLSGGESARAADVPARVVLTATGADGRPLFRGPVGGADTASSPAPAAAAAPAAGASVSFPAAPGQVDLRIVVENARGQVIDSTTQSLAVPDYGKTSVALGTPRVYRARTAREMLLVRNNLDATPTANREFSRGDRMLIRFDAYAAGGARPEVTAKLLNRTGATMADVPVQAADGKPFQIDFPLASLAAGEYLIQIDAKGASGAAQYVLAFKVGS